MGKLPTEEIMPDALFETIDRKMQHVVEDLLQADQALSHAATGITTFLQDRYPDAPHDIPREYEVSRHLDWLAARIDKLAQRNALQMVEARQLQAELRDVRRWPSKEREKRSAERRT